MQHFLRYEDTPNPQKLLELARSLRENPLAFQEYGRGKTLCLLFFNPSLRTRLSTQKAAYNLGMNVMVMNVGQESWQLELEDGTTMDGSTQEHIREAAAVVSQYADVIGLRTFAELHDRQRDYAEPVLSKFVAYAQVPVFSLESATRHPLQGLADWLTIATHTPKPRPKVVLSWTPHPKPLPQAVANSFVSWLKNTEVELVVTQPEGFALAPEITEGVPVLYDQMAAFEQADFIYAKSWASYQNYGQHDSQRTDWCIGTEQMARTNAAHFMHCLPVRRNVVVRDAVLDAPQSLVLEQAKNRIFSAQAVLLRLLGYP